MLSLGLHLTQIQPLLTITVIVHAAFESRCLNNQAYKDLPPADRPRYRIVGIGSKDASTEVLGQTAIEHNEGFPLLFADLMAKKSVASSPSGTVFPPVEQSPEMLLNDTFAFESAHYVRAMNIPGFKIWTLLPAYTSALSLSVYHYLIFLFHKFNS